MEAGLIVNDDTRAVAKPIDKRNVIVLLVILIVILAFLAFYIPWVAAHLDDTWDWGINVTKELQDNHPDAFYQHLVATLTFLGDNLCVGF